MDERAVIRGVEIAHETTGIGTALVWAHGLNSNRAAEDRFPLVDTATLAESHRVTRYDARGHGASGFTSELEPYRWDNMARDQLALADHLGIDSYVAGGASLGAATALQAAVLAPERIDGLLLVIPPTCYETRAAQVQMYGQMADIVSARGVDPLIRAVDDLDPPVPFRRDGSWHEQRRISLREADPERMPTLLRGAAIADLPDRDLLRGITAPTLILAWEGDPGHPASTAELLTGLLKNVTLQVATSRPEFDTWTEMAAVFMAGV